MPFCWHPHVVCCVPKTPIPSPRFVLSATFSPSLRSCSRLLFPRGTPVTCKEKSLPSRHIAVKTPDPKISDPAPAPVQKPALSRDRQHLQNGQPRTESRNTGSSGEPGTDQHQRLFLRQGSGRFGLGPPAGGHARVTHEDQVHCSKPAPENRGALAARVPFDAQAIGRGIEAGQTNPILILQLPIGPKSLLPTMFNQLIMFRID